VAAFMGYSAAQSASSHPETFGKGDIKPANNNAACNQPHVPSIWPAIPVSGNLHMAITPTFESAPWPALRET